MALAISMTFGASIARAENVMVDKQTLHAAFLLSGLAFLIPTINGIVSIWDKMRRKPPLDQELQLYAKKADLAIVEKRVMDVIEEHCERHDDEMKKHAEEQTQVVRDIFSRINSMQGAINESMKDVMHELGVLTGRITRK